MPLMQSVFHRIVRPCNPTEAYNASGNLERNHVNDATAALYTRLWQCLYSKSMLGGESI